MLTLVLMKFISLANGLFCSSWWRPTSRPVSSIKSILSNVMTDFKWKMKWTILQSALKTENLCFELIYPKTFKTFSMYGDQRFHIFVLNISKISINYLWFCNFSITSIDIWTLAFDSEVALVVVIERFPSFTVEKIFW